MDKKLEILFDYASDAITTAELTDLKEQTAQFLFQNQNASVDAIVKNAQSLMNRRLDKIRESFEALYRELAQRK